MHSIAVLRELGCKLPIQLFYVGQDDLSLDNQIRLKKQGVELVDVSGLLSSSRRQSLRGWSVKPLAMLLSRFQEFIFIDADVLFLQNPEKLFKSKLYLNTGTLYFRDRTINYSSYPTLKFFKSMVSHPSKMARDGRIWRDISVHEGESGVIVMDKKRGGMFVLLMATLLNMNPLNQIMYDLIFGDKESYWMSSEALNVPYSWAPGGGGAIGYLNPNKSDSVCGGLYHMDENYDPLWFNGGIEMNKHTQQGRLNTINITHVAIDVIFSDVEW